MKIGAKAARGSLGTPPASAPERVVSRLGKREREARMRGLVDEHIRYVARVLRHLGTPAMDIEDGVQRTFIVASNYVDRIRPGHERGFLFKVAAGVAAHARRSIARRNRVIVLADDEPIEAAVASERASDETRMRKLLGTILDGMPFELRSVFVLHDFEGMTQAQIAKMLETPVGTIASRLRRARIAFKSTLGALNR